MRSTCVTSVIYQNMSILARLLVVMKYKFNTIINRIEF